MFEKVNPSHPDKIADRIAGAIVDIIKGLSPKAKVAAEVLAGHGNVHAIVETSFYDTDKAVQPIKDAIDRICAVEKLENNKIKIDIVPQDVALEENEGVGDNGVYYAKPITKEQAALARLASNIYSIYHTDGKYLIAPYPRGHGAVITICQSHGDSAQIRGAAHDFAESDEYLQREQTIVKVNPLGDWTGGLDVDCGVTNRKLGSDLGYGSLGGGGLSGKDCSKGDVAINIWAFLLAQYQRQEVNACCTIGGLSVRYCLDGGEWLVIPYRHVKLVAEYYIGVLGGYEALSTWGLIQPLTGFERHIDEIIRVMSLHSLKLT